MKYFLCSLAFLCLSANSQELTGRFSDLENWEFSTNGVRFGSNMRDLKIQRTWRSASHRGPVIVAGTINRDTLQFRFQYTVPLPQDSIFLSFDFKNRQLETLALRLYFYGKKERFIDSLVFSLRPEGHNHIRFNNLTGAEWVEVTLDGQRGSLGRDTVSFQILDARIEAKNHHLDEWFRSLTFDLNVESLYPLKKITGLDELVNRKIIGLGESVHGSQNLWREKAEIVRKLFSKNVKLVCFEAPVDKCLNWDLYVRGIHPYSYRDVIFEDVESFADNEDLVRFLDEIRKENGTRKEADRIRIVGLDLRSAKSYFYHYFLAYQELCKDSHSITPLILNMSELSYNNLYYKLDFKQPPYQQLDTTANKRFSNLASILASDKKLKSLMQQNDYQFISDILLLEVPTIEDNKYWDFDRDFYMWRTFQKALSHYAPGENDRAVILAHSLHLCRTGHERHSVSDLLKSRSLGSYIAENYPDDYWAISFHAGGGVIRTVEYKALDVFNTEAQEGIGRLKQPVRGSFERAARDVSFDRFYCRSSDLGNDWYAFRMVGNKLDESQFYTLSKERFDAFVYIDESTRFMPTPLHSYTNVGHLIDSLKLQNIPYSNTCEHYVDCLDLAVPNEFRYKDFGGRPIYFRNISPIENQASPLGLFESKDKECLMIFTPASHLSNMSVEEARLYELRKALGISTHGELQISKGNIVKLFRNLEGDVWELKSDEYAKKNFNADSVSEIWTDTDFYFLGKNYMHKQVFIIEKDEKVWLIYCYYTDKGITNQDKYRKGIESVVKFH
ncbi:MAG: erythromycin esterase family protein [Petrimonas sp.]|uniref:erythromycin esterase family protein n=1 Tax=Petrimonas sp. TaxID=2023866 RepID=UPI002A27A222|nr:erythromycin esterase family protein [Parabacteroides sp.]MEA4997193.1 erythromycin esterase family protein [Petrimonas sp.]MEA5044898.1 erythromycin esterase family protein [Petrimonas sp.]